MAYVKPGIEITQEQRSQTPILISPDLNAVIIGKGYHWQDPMLDESFLDVVYDNTQLIFHLSGINDTYYNVSGEESLVLVDLVQSADTIYHLENGVDFTVNNNQVTINASVMTAGSTDAYVRVGYRADKPESEGCKEMSSLGDIITLIGSPVTWNPLAFGASLAQQQFNRTIFTYGLDSESGANYTAAFAGLETQEVYAIACMSHDSGILATGLAHVNDMSLAANKKERILFVNKPITWTGTEHAETSSDKLLTATAMKEIADAYQEKRLFITFPDWGYVEEKRHITTIKSSWVKESFNSLTGSSFTTISDDSYFQCKFAADLKVGTTRYKRGEAITDAKWQVLVDNGYHELTVFSPVPGFYYDAAIVGQVAGKEPQQPLTNLPISGITRTLGSWDYFSESNLNVIASGGVYIMYQTSATSPVVSRHQMSTNVLSIAKRELSITTAIDYTAKFIRNTMNPYIGRYVIDGKFLSLVNATLSGVGQSLVVGRVLADFNVVSITQNELNPDTVEVEADLLPYYPVNYIRITLVF